MKPLYTALIAVTLAATGVVATGIAGSRISQASLDKQMERLGSRCDEGNVLACERLALVTDGQCAGPAGSGCRYTLEVRKPD